MTVNVNQNEADPSAACGRAGGLHRLLPYLLIAAFFLLLIVPLIFKSDLTVFDVNDETKYHYQTIRAFLDQFPKLNLANYRSATTPLYHLVFMAIALVIGPGIIPLRLINAAIALACVLFIYHWLSRRMSKPAAAYFTVLTLLSPYFIGPAVRLSTDTAGLFLALISIFSLEFGDYGLRSALAGNLLILATVLTRQLYVWLIGAYLACGAIYLAMKKRLRAKPLLILAFPALIPSAALAAFIMRWGGLTTPGFAFHEAQILNLNAPIYVLAMIGEYGLFFAIPLWRIFRRWRYPWIAVILLASVMMLALAFHPMVALSDEGVGGGALWAVAGRLPSLGRVSVLFWALAPLGLVFTCLLGSELVRKKEYVLPVAFLLWLGATIVNNRTFQKYYDPFVLFVLGYALAPAEWKKWYEWIGPAVLILGFAVVAVLRFYFNMG